MTEAFIVDAVRSPVGRRNGGLAQVHPADLGAHSIRALMDRVDVDPAAVEDVVFGCVDTIGPQAGDIARTCWLVAGLPDDVPGTTVDRLCGSSLQAVHVSEHHHRAHLLILQREQRLQRQSLVEEGLLGSRYRRGVQEALAHAGVS